MKRIYKTFVHGKYIWKCENHFLTILFLYSHNIPCMTAAAYRYRSDAHIFFTWSILKLGEDISCPNTLDMSNCVGCMSLKKCVTVTAVFIKIWIKILKIVPYFSFWCRAVSRLKQLRRLPSSDVCFYKLSYLNYRQLSYLRCTKSEHLKDSLILEILRKAHYLF